MKITIENFEKTVDSVDFDIIHRQVYGVETKINQSSIIRIWFNEKCISLKLELEQALVQNFDFLFVPETNILFYRNFNEWCVFDLSKCQVIRVEKAFYFPSIERTNNTVLVYDELSVHSLNLSGEIIDDVPVDPPYEEVVYIDRIEFTSPVYGKQT
ncbi:hypothetical protein, partial [Nonlabens ulvanivorans]